MSRVKDEVFDPLKALDEQGEHPVSWKPEPGDVLTGVIRRYSMVTLEESGDTYIAAIQDAPDSVRSVFLSSTVLKGEFSRQKPKVGEKVVIRYLGKPAGKRYHKFTLMMPDRPDVGITPDWNKMDSDQGIYNESVPDAKSGPYAQATVSGGRGGAAVAQRPEPAPAVDDEDPFADA